jgi:hypothetical protein
MVGEELRMFGKLEQLEAQKELLEMIGKMQKENANFAFNNYVEEVEREGEFMREVDEK